MTTMHHATARCLHLASTILVSFLIFLLLKNLSPTTSALVIDRPLLINGTTVWDGLDIMVEKEVRIIEGGALRVDSCNLTFDGDYDLEAGIIIEPGGTLIIVGGDARSVLRRGPTNTSYFLRAQPETVCRFEETDFIGLGQQHQYFNLWYMGVCLRSEVASFQGCRFIDCHVGVGTEGTKELDVRDCSFIGCYWAILTVSSGCQTVEGCSFEGCRNGVWIEDHIFGIGSVDVDVYDCTFVGCRQPIMISGWKGIVRNSTVQGAFETGLSIGDSAYMMIIDSIFMDCPNGIGLSRVVNIAIRGGALIRCGNGIVAKRASLSLEETSFNSCGVALSSWSSSVEMDHVSIVNGSTGIDVPRRFENGERMGSITVRGSDFIDVEHPFIITNGIDVNIRDCALSGTSLRIDLMDMATLLIDGIVLNVDMSELDAFSISDVKISNISISTGRLNLSFDACEAQLFNPFADSDRLSVRLVNSTTVWSCVGPDSIALEILDEQSVFYWVKWVDFIVMLASTGAPATGCGLTVLDASEVPILDCIIGGDGLSQPQQLRLGMMTGNFQELMGPMTAFLTLAQTVQVEPLDIADEPEDRISIHWVLDDMPPRIHLAEPSEGGTYPGPSVIVTGTASDESGEVSIVRFELDGSPVRENGPEWSFGLASALGWHRLRVIATDARCNTAFAEVWYLVSGSEKHIIIDAPVNGSWTNQSRINVTGHAEGVLWLSVNGQTVAPSQNGSFSIIVDLDEGENLITVRWRTYFLENSLILSIKRDTKAPVINLDPTPSITNSTHLYLRGIIVDENGGSMLWVDGERIPLQENGSFETMISLSDGEHTLHLAAKDSSGNQATTVITTLVDTSVGISILDDPPVRTDVVDLPLKLLSEPGAILDVLVNGKMVGRYTFLADTLVLMVSLDSGNNNISLLANDVAGNTCEVSLSIVFDPPATAVHVRYPWSWTILAVISGTAASIVLLASIRKRFGERM